MTRPTRIEIVTAWPVFDDGPAPHTNYHCLRSLVGNLRSAGVEVRLVAPDPSVFCPMSRGERLAAWSLDLVAGGADRPPRASRDARIAASLNRKLAATASEPGVVTVVCCPPLIASMLRIRPSSIFLWDGPEASWHVMTNTEESKDAARFSAIKASEERLFERVRYVAFPAQWSVRAARELYPRCNAEFVVADWGLNREIPDAAALTAALDARLARPGLRVAMIASDWTRKRGHVALEAIGLLHAGGRPAELRYFGRAEPALPYSREEFKYMGYFDHTPASSARFVELLLECHLVVLPSAAEMYPHAIRECARLGIPAIVSDVAGTPEIVLDGRTGVVVRDVEPQAYAAALAGLLDDPRRLREVSLETMRESARFNWERLAQIVLATPG